MKIASWNVNSLKVRLPQVLEWLLHSQVDILALQELKIDNDNFPSEELSEHGFYFVSNGQKTYNGVALIAKHPINQTFFDIPHYIDHQKRVIAATINGIRVIGVYVVNGEAIDSPKFIYKQQWLHALTQYLTQELAKYPKLVLLGDFNIAPQDVDVYDPVALKDHILCSPLERGLWQNILNLGFVDSFRLVNQESEQYTWWDYRNMAFRRKRGMRIDHILVSHALEKEVIDCTIDVLPRKNERPSDHAPITLLLYDQR